jgi:subtilisin family serine protease
MRTRYQIGLWTIALLALLLSLAGAQQIAPRDRAKVDAVLLIGVEGLSKQDPSLSSAIVTTGDERDPIVHCVVKITSPGAVESIRALGARVGSVRRDIATVYIPASRFARLAALPTVSYIENSYRLYPNLDAALPEAKVNTVHTYDIPPLDERKCDGAGVIIGATDTGIDFAHNDFRKNADTNTRVMWLWDQDDNTGTPPSGRGFNAALNYGSLYNNTEMDAGPGSCPHQDTGGHGSHVMGIAGGDGSSSGSGYVGCAPAADLIMVQNLGNQFWEYSGYYASTTDTLDAFDFIRAAATAAGRPHVINMSQGSNMGPHDGTTLFEQGINADVAAGSPVCLAAGNEGNSQRHIMGTVPAAGDFTVGFTYNWWAGFEIWPGYMDCWYQGADKMYIEIQDPGGVWRGPYDPDVVGNQGVWLNSGGVWYLAIVNSTLNASINGDNRWFVQIDHDDVAKDTNWQLRFTPKGGALPGGGGIHCWIERNYRMWFPSAAQPDSYTFGIPSGAEHAITVGSHVSKNEWMSKAGGPYAYSPKPTVGSLSTFSGRGPLREGTYRKPDITAPGSVLMSTKSQHYTTQDALIDPDEKHVIMQGTSMASPMVAGVVALMLQKNGNLTPAQIKQKLISTAADDAFTGPVPNDNWGAGKMRADGAWNAVETDAGVGEFTAVKTGAGVQLAWQVTDDIDCVGFEVWRAASIFEGWTKINESLVTAAGKAFSFTDTTVPHREGHYLYIVKSVDSRGETKLRASTMIDFGRRDKTARQTAQLQELVTD